MNFSALLEAEDVAKRIADQVSLQSIRYEIPKDKRFKVIDVKHSADQEPNGRVQPIARDLMILVPKGSSDALLVSESPSGAAIPLDFSKHMRSWRRVHHHFNFGVPCSCCEFTFPYDDEAINNLIDGGEELEHLILEAIQEALEEHGGIDRLFLKMPGAQGEVDSTDPKIMNGFLPVKVLHVRDHNPFWFVKV